MSNYIKSTDFAVKDALTTGDPNKIIKGSEIDTECNALATAVGSKADKASPAFTGTPTAPTAAALTNTTQLATTAYVQTQKVSPIFTGTPTAPTPVTTTIDTTLATCAFVNAFVNQPGKNSRGTRYISSSNPTGGADGDMWYKY